MLVSSIGYFKPVLNSNLETSRGGKVSKTNMPEGFGNDNAQMLQRNDSFVSKMISNCKSILAGNKKDNSEKYLSLIA